MSNADPQGVSTIVERDGVTVKKSFEPDDFPVPAIAFVVRSSREETVEVTVVERLPSDVDTEDVGLHPKYGAEFWSLKDDRIIFERDFQPGEEYTTVYGVRARDRDNVERFLDEPDLSVDPELDRQGVVEEVVGGDSASIEAAIGGIDVADAEEDSVVESAPSSIEAALGDVENSPSPDGDDFAAVLAEQLRAGRVSQDDLDVLREALAGEVGGSVDARVAQLQREVSDLQAYTSALEEFLDENGDAQRFVADVRAELSALEDDIDRAVSGTNTVEETVTDLEASLAALETKVSALTDLDERVTRVEGQVDHLETLDERVEELTEVGARVEAVETTSGDLSQKVSELDAGVEGLTEDVADVDDDVSTIESDVDRLQSGLTEVRDELAEGADVSAIEERLDALEAEFDGVRSDLQELAEMREQLRSVFGAGALESGEE